MKTYSNDLRTKIVEAYENKEVSMRQLARQFFVSLRFVWKLISRYRETGNVDPKPHGGGQQPKIDEVGLKILRGLAEERPDATVEELQKYFIEKSKVEVSRATIGRALLTLNLTVKKKLYMRQSKILRKSKSIVKSTLKKSKK